MKGRNMWIKWGLGHECGHWCSRHGGWGHGGDEHQSNTPAWAASTGGDNNAD